MNNLERLVKRDDYKTNLPPWSIFRVSKQKFTEYRIAWQEIAKRFEATHLPTYQHITLCPDRSRRLVIPIQKVYFVSEKDKCTSVVVLAYLNSSIARSLLKLIAWPARGGYFEHISYTVGHLPLPLLGRMKRVCDSITSNEAGDLNDIARGMTETIEHDIIAVANINDDERGELVRFATWLNETTRDPAKTKSPN